MEFKPHKIEWSGEKSARIWDYYSSNHHYRNNFFGLQVGHLIASYIYQSIPLTPSAKILDFSCGMGDILEQLINKSKSHYTFYGTDFSEKNVEYVTRRFKGNTKFKGIKFLRNLPSDLPDNEFELVLLTEVIEHLTDEEINGTLSEIYRVLKPGGFVFITTPNKEIYEAGEQLCPDCGCIYHRWQHLRVWDRVSLSIYVEKFKFNPFIVKELNWVSWKSKILTFYKKREKGGLVYIGQKPKN